MTSPSSTTSGARTTTSLPDISAVTSILTLVVGFAFFAGIAYAFVAIPSQTQLQEDLPESVRGRVFGVLNMLVSVASFPKPKVFAALMEQAGFGAVRFQPLTLGIAYLHRGEKPR